MTVDKRLRKSEVRYHLEKENVLERNVEAKIKKSSCVLRKIHIHLTNENLRIYLKKGRITYIKKYGK